MASSTFSVHDLVSCRRCSPPVPHPTKPHTVAYSVTDYDASIDQSTTSLWCSTMADASRVTGVKGKRDSGNALRHDRMSPHGGSPTHS